MAGAHFKFWPDHAMHNLMAPATNMFYNAEVSARRFPHKPFLVYYDTLVSFSEFHDEAQRIAGYLEQRCGILKGDRVLLLMQNSPQFMIGYYGILRANAVVVPLNPMNLTQEILRYAKDCGANTLLVSQELYPRVEPLLKSGDLRHVIVAAYSDYLKEATSLAVPDFITAARVDHQAQGLTLWKDVLAANLKPGPLTAGPDDLCVMPYTSGTTGQPKGCMHTHRTVMHTTAGGMQWFALQPEFTLLAVAPMFQTLRTKMETEWTPGMMRLLGIERDALPIIWDADFLYGPRSVSGEDTYVLCEINVSSVFAIPDQAPEAIARLALTRLRSANASRGTGF